jgi:GNAT superfamily N-acetyltransferase
MTLPALTRPTYDTVSSELVPANLVCQDLKLLQTDPRHQRRGAGSMLIRWGLDESERRGVPAYLEAIEEGRSL